MNMKKKTIIAIATLLAFGQGAWADGTVSFPLHYDAVNNPEDGSADHPYQIQSVNDLNTLASDVNSGTDYSGKCFVLTADLDYSGVALFDSDEDDEADSNFTPIGTFGDVDAIPFSGKFDGNGKTIKGIIVNQPSGMYIGLFGCIRYATIKDITLTGCKFTGNTSVGGIVGDGTGSKSNPAFIENCNVDETVEITGVELKYTDDESGEEQTLSGSSIGGIIGFCTTMTVKDCTSNAKVTGDEAIGGIVGLLTGTNSAHSVLANSFYLSDVSNIVSTGTKGAVVGEIQPDETTFSYSVIATDINLTLLDNDSEATIKNATRLSNYNGLEVNVTLSGRTLYKDGSWNTLCLPFNATLTGDFSGADIRTLSDATFSEGTLTLDFTPTSGEGAVTSIEAGKPYIIKWTSGDDFTPTFEGVTVSSAAPTDVAGTAANFHGIYTPYSTGGENKSMLYLGANNKLYYPSADMTINAFRAYFTLNGITAGDLPTQARAFVLNFGDESTGIVSLSTDSKDFKDNAAWYTLDGRKLSGKPATKGLYINNGKKIVIK